MIQDSLENYFVQQGWQCPICKRIYSPTTPMCFTCGGETTTSATTTTNTSGQIGHIISQQSINVLDNCGGGDR